MKVEQKGIRGTRKSGKKNTALKEGGVLERELKRDAQYRVREQLLGKKEKVIDPWRKGRLT